LNEECKISQTDTQTHRQTELFPELLSEPKIEMGIFTNPSDVPEPGPPPKKETVRVELSGCGFMCGEVAGSAVLNCPKCNASVWSQVSTSTKTIGTF